VSISRNSRNSCAGPCVTLRVRSRLT